MNDKMQRFGSAIEEERNRKNLVAEVMKRQNACGTIVWGEDDLRRMSVASLERIAFDCQQANAKAEEERRAAKIERNKFFDLTVQRPNDSVETYVLSFARRHEETVGDYEDRFADVAKYAAGELSNIERITTVQRMLLDSGFGLSNVIVKAVGELRDDQANPSAAEEYAADYARLRSLISRIIKNAKFYGVSATLENRSGCICIDYNGCDGREIDFSFYTTPFWDCETATPVQVVDEAGELIEHRLTELQIDWTGCVSVDASRYLKAVREAAELIFGDACPGCGCESGEGKTDGCDHPIGCGFDA
jgi:hypothetical protein